MELFGVAIETIYLYTLIISGAVTILYLFFGDFLSFLLEGFINQSLERKQNTERELEQARKELDRHRNRERAHGQ